VSNQIIISNEDGELALEEGQRRIKRQGGGGRERRLAQEEGI
jgi:hypothetical protein